MSELLIIIIVIASLVLILTFLLSFIVKNTNNLMKNVFVDRMSEFDFLLEDKEKKVDELNDDIKKKTEIITQLEEKAKEFDTSESVKKDDMVMPKFTDFEDGNIFYNYKVIKKAFNYDPVDVLKKFISKNNASEIEEYKMLKIIRSYFSFEVIYKIGMYQPSEQQEIIKSILTKDEEKISVGEKRIYAPNVIAISNGKAIQLETGISEDLKDPYGKLTKEIKKYAYNKFKCLLKCLEEESITCQKNSC